MGAGGKGPGSGPNIAPLQKAGAGEMTSEGAAGVGGWVLTAQVSSIRPSYLAAPSPEARRLLPTGQGAGHRFLQSWPLGPDSSSCPGGTKVLCLFLSREDGESHRSQEQSWERAALGSGSLCTRPHLIPTVTLGIRDYNPHFTEETKRGKVTANRCFDFPFFSSFLKNFSWEGSCQENS